MTQGSIRVEFDTEDAIRQLTSFREGSLRAVQQAQLVVARELLKDAKLFVPVLTGALKDSGRVEDVPSYSDAVEAVQVIFGSADVVYAAIQHDHPFWHPSLGFHGAARFLAQPLEINGQFYLRLFLAEYQFLIQGL